MLNVTRGSSSSNHVVQGWLKSNNTGVNCTQVKIMVNDTEYLPPLTDSSGYFCLSLDLQPVNNQSTTYIIIASFEDTSHQPLNCTAWAVTLDGQVYAECTTVHCGLKPSTNYAIVTVEPQATQITADEDMTVSQANETTTQSSVQVPPQKTPEELQKEAEDNGWLSAWVGPGDSLFTWLKYYAMVHIDWLNFTVKVWVGFPFGAGLEECSGLQNIFIKAYEAVPEAAIDFYTSTATNTIAMTAAAFATGMTATFLTQGTPAYLIALGAYTGGMALAMALIYAWAERALGKSVLTTMGGTLLGFLTALFVPDPTFNLQWGFDKASQSGKPYEIEAGKVTYNYFINSALRYICVSLGFGAWVLNAPFNVFMAVLALSAGYLASTM